MIIGVPREMTDHEYRVGMIPAGVRVFTSSGHKVLVESGAGEGSGISDSSFKEAGAEIISERERVFAEADIIVKVKEPLPAEYSLLHSGQILCSFLHLAANERLTRVLLEKEIVAVAFETIELPDHSHPLLTPMSDIAGRMAVQVGIHYLQKDTGGVGILLCGLPGVMPGMVTILGGGIAGAGSARIAVGLGARVTVIDRSSERLRHLEGLFSGRIMTLFSTPDDIEGALLEADLVIGAVLLSGRRTPRLVSREMIRRMKKGAVVVDVSVDQGGCFETSHPTTHSSPTFIVDGIIHYCVTNMPGVVPRTATYALAAASLYYLQKIAEGGIEEAVRADSALLQGLNLYKGSVTHPGVAESLGIRPEPITAYGA